MTSPLPPQGCARCKSLDTEPHCKSPCCPWLRCLSCRSITGWAFGGQRFIPGPGVQ